ncbi:MAG: hypothetical protein UHI85_00440, partial [Turicibacter sp.]|nr:hypothetical protein [Turicibacter sp.]
MSRINRIRIVNLNYNHNAIRIDDECFDLVNENTLLSLRNGGGKSVLIQMITAPFVHKRYRDAGERRFESYFTTNQPTFIMVEWSLDQEAGYVLTGMMVRKNQESKEEDENRPELEMINFVHEYEVENEYDIKNFPLLIQDQNKKTLKVFHVCRQLFEQCKQNKQLKFDYYDMNQHPRSRAYFEKLEEFQIYAKEWESIIKKVNLKESGLSELFKDAKDEKGLTEKWFLEAVENKLNQNQDRMKNFESLLKKYILQYKANEGNFKRKEGILSFQEELQLILELENQLLKSETDVHEYETKLAKLYVILEQLHQQATLEKADKEEQLESLRQQQHRLAYEQQSLQIYELIAKQQQIEQQKTDEKRREQQLKERQEATLKQQHIYEAANRYQTYKQASVDVQRYESELAVVKQSQEALMPRLNDIGYSLSLIYEAQFERETDELDQLRLHLQDVASEQKQIKNKLEVNQDDRQQLSSQIGRLESVVSQFDEVEQRFSAKYQEELRRNLEGFYAPNELESKLGDVKLQLEQVKKQKKQALEQEQQLEEEQHKISRDIEDAKQTQGTLTKTIEINRQELQHLEEELEIRHRIRAYIAWPEDKILDTNGMIEALNQKRQIVVGRMRDLERELDEKQKEKEQLTKGDVLPLPEHLKQRFDEEGIQFISGVDWLKKNQYSSEKNHQLIENNPFLPYSIILSATQMKQLKSIDLELKTSFPIPILIREQLELESGINYVAGHCQFEQLHFYMYFNEELLDEYRLQQLVQLKEKEIVEIQDKHQTQQQYLTRYEDQINTLKYQKLSAQTYEEAKEKLDNCLKEQEVLHHQFMQFQAKKEQIREALDATSKQLQSIQEVIRFSELKLEDYQQLINAYER